MSRVRGMSAMHIAHINYNIKHKDTQRRGDYRSDYNPYHMTTVVCDENAHRTVQ